MSEENEIDMYWNGDKDLAMMISYVKEPIWNEGKDDLYVKCHLRELLQKCSGGKIIKMLKNILSPEEKSALVETELESFFRNQAEFFKNHMKTKNEPDSSDQVKIKVEHISEENQKKTEQKRPCTENTASEISTFTSFQKTKITSVQFKHPPEVHQDPLHKVNHFSNMECVISRFPYLAEQIFQKLNDQDLTKCLKLSRSWKKFIEHEKFYWIRIIILISADTNCSNFSWRRDILEKLLDNLDEKVVKEIGAAACETRRHKDRFYRNIFYFAFVSGQTGFLKKLFHHPEFLNYAIDIKEFIEAIILYHAAERGDLEVFQFVIQNALKKNPRMHNIYLPTSVPGVSENTPLHVAAENGHLAICQLIVPYLKNGRNPKNKSSGRTPLELAASNGHFEVCKLFVSNVKIWNPENSDKQTPLHSAAKNGHFDVCALILSNIKDSSPKDLFYETPLHYAAKNGHSSICKLLVTKVGDKNPKSASGMTPLHYAAKNGFVAICKLISETVTYINPQDNLGFTPFQLAEQNGHFEICQLLERNPKRRKLGKIDYFVLDRK